MSWSIAPHLVLDPGPSQIHGAAGWNKVFHSGGAVCFRTVQRSVEAENASRSEGGCSGPIYAKRIPAMSAERHHAPRAPTRASSASAATSGRSSPRRPARTAAATRCAAAPSTAARPPCASNVPSTPHRTISTPASAAARIPTDTNRGRAFRRDCLGLAQGKGGAWPHQTAGGNQHGRQVTEGERQIQEAGCRGQKSKGAGCQGENGAVAGVSWKEGQIVQAPLQLAL
jgi:hypothetical protein